MEKTNGFKGPLGRAKRLRLEEQQRRLKDGTPEQVLTIEADSLLSKIQHYQQQQQQNDEREDHDEVISRDGGERGSKEGQDQYLAGDQDDKRRPGTSSSRPRTSRPDPHTELELEIVELSSTGDGLAYAPPSKDFIYVVPFAVPGDRVLAKTFPQREESPLWARVDFVKLVRPSPRREGVSPQCPYFGVCSGCQLQMLPYADQLAHKKTIVEKAFKHFSNLDPSQIPPVDDTIGSPLQYGYRTKLTPHYSGGTRSKPLRQGDDPPPFGFMKKNTPHILDIEQCPIGTPILNKGLKIQRKKMHGEFWKSKNGATVLLRESTRREMIPSSARGKISTQDTLSGDDDGPKEMVESANANIGKNGQTTPSASSSSSESNTQDLSSLPLAYAGEPLSTELSFPSPTTPEITYTYPRFRDIKTYTSDNKALTTEHIGPYTFTTRANSFFQNNNSILPTFLTYIRENLLPKSTPPQKSVPTTPTPAPVVSWVGSGVNVKSESEEEAPGPTKEIKYLLDAYCGSGLFSIALAPYFSSVLGIDIDALSISCARDNAKLNHTANARENAAGESNTGFIAADAQALFTDVPFPPSQTLVVIDPPRKGASPDFLQQLCNFGPKRVVYVSCNVHTQARDVGMLVAGFPGGRWRYRIEKLGGFDFFPQTGHVEGVCFLNRVG
ncbi:uncharacterized protein Z520_00872 [Fonsecaea multimorphosa CBS 102226]|uniref:TRAM domain-containing protein n=1 Tax=Fonsecaea multimorphosa CBS 102226 TaxID=1442371 RepID=A0A0D2KL11_9EURO|nr:uncharacterized protein Z520_00872 [Fonsecaea multimorphosa CBS 102226]KIY04180.1 hypothetical protein Z520_00872 [Fonsecaea multimorphosa CBS 102226]OAL32009.1 hypothetical protein AYO22_00879 [Fonsecaea multimorphosa]